MYGVRIIVPQSGILQRIQLLGFPCEIHPRHGYLPQDGSQNYRIASQGCYRRILRWTWQSKSLVIP